MDKLDADLVNGPRDDDLDWDTISWLSVEGDVRRLRRRIFKASQDGDFKRVRNLQKLMLRSRSNTLVSVRRVTLCFVKMIPTKRAVRIRPVWRGFRPFERECAPYLR